MKKQPIGAKNFKRSQAAKQSWMKRARNFVGKHKGKIAVGAVLAGGLLAKKVLGSKRVQQGAINFAARRVKRTAERFDKANKTLGAAARDVFTGRAVGKSARIIGQGLTRTKRWWDSL